MFTQSTSILVKHCPLLPKEPQELNLASLSLIRRGTPIGSLAGSSDTTVLNNIPVLDSGTYAIAVESSAGVSGAFSATLYLNSGVELEPTGINNDSLANAENLEDLSVAWGSVDRMAVVGSLDIAESSILVSDGLDSGPLGSDWTTSSSTGFGRIQVTGAFGTAGGAGALLMDSNTDNNFARNEAIWTVDLTGIVSPSLSFFHAEWSDETEPLPASFTGSVDGDGVSVSDDGVTWHTILNAPDTPAGVWNDFRVDLGQLAANLGLTLGSNFPSQIPTIRQLQSGNGWARL